MLSSAAKRALRARAHSLRPTVMVGAAGVTAPVVAETARTLDDHELIKVRFAADDREAFRTAAAELAGQLDAELVQTVGRIAVLYRESEAAADSPGSGAPGRSRAARPGGPVPKRPGKGPARRIGQGRSQGDSRGGSQGRGEARGEGTAKGPGRGAASGPGKDPRTGSGTGSGMGSGTAPRKPTRRRSGPWPGR